MAPSVRLVLVHGTQMNAGQWTGYADLLGPDVDLVAIDLPGHGARRDERFTWSGALAAIDAAVRPAGETDPLPVVLGGHSLGGYLSMAYAHRYPDELAGLAPLGSAAIPRGPGAAAYRLFGAAQLAAGPARMGAVLDRHFRRHTAPEMAQALHEGGYALAATGPAWDGVMAHCRPSMLREVTCPILFVNGQFDQLRVHAKAYAAAARHAAWTHVTILPGTGHLFPLTRPRQTVEALQQLLAVL